MCSHLHAFIAFHAYTLSPFLVPFLSFFLALQGNQESQKFWYAISPGCPLRCPPFIFSPLSSQAGAGRIKMDKLGHGHAGFHQGLKQAQASNQISKNNNNDKEKEYASFPFCSALLMA